jgi:hypothetical protein
MNALTRPDYAPATLVPTNLTEAIRLAEAMAAARTVPKHLQGSVGDCLMVVEQSMRWGMSPFAVAQCTSVIAGKLMYEGKLVAAVVETSHAIVGHLDYEFTGTGEGRGVIISATRRGETNPRTATVMLKDARTSNEMWKRQPDQQLVYHGARVWARRWAPAALLGVYSPEEMGPVIEGNAEPAHAGPTIEAVAEHQPEASARGAAEIPDTNPVYRFATKTGGQTYRTGSEYLERWRRLVEACKATDALDKLQQAMEMNAGAIEAVAEFDPQAATEVREMLAEVLGVAADIELPA